MAAVTSFNDTLGALFIGFAVSTVIYGILFVQVYNYCRRYPSDKVGYKTIVMLLLVLETLQQALIGYSVYYYTITNFLNELALLDKPIWSLISQILVGAIIGTVVRLLFSLRVWRFSKGNVWLMAFLTLLNIGQLVIAVAFVAESYALPTVFEPVYIRILGSVALGTGVMNDISVAVALYYYLRTMRTSYKQTNSLVRRLTLYAVNTGVLTSALSLSTLLVYNVMPGSFVFVGCYFVLSKLYATSFVATLNTRKSTRGRSSTDFGPKGFSITDQRARSVNVTLHSIAVTGDNRDVVSGSGEEHGGIIRDSGENLVMTPIKEDLVSDKARGIAP